MSYSGHLSFSAPAGNPLPKADTVLKEEAVIPTKQVAKEIKEDKERMARLHWKKLFSAGNSNYGIGVLGGIKDLKVIFYNNSDYHVEQAVIKLTYIKSNGAVWRTMMVPVYGTPAHESKEQSLPDVGR